MTVKIGSKITGFAVKKKEATSAEVVPAPVAVTPKQEASKPSFIEMNENVGRPEMLFGATYKIKPPTSEHAMYITINDIVLNEGTEHAERRPYEIFINSKENQHFQWVVALTRVISAIFRKGGDIVFLVEELGAVYDPNGGYYKKGGVFVPSLVAEIAGVIKRHLEGIGMVKGEELSPHVQAILNEKRAQFEQKQSAEKVDSTGFPPSATLCPKCSTKAVIILDGCKTCLSCGDSKCQ